MRGWPRWSLWSSISTKTGEDEDRAPGLGYLLGCCRLASTNGPHRLIGQDNLAPILHVIYGTEITGGRVKTRKNITSCFPENESAGGLLPPGGYYRKVTLEAGVEVIGRIQDSHPPLSCISTR